MAASKLSEHPASGEKMSKGLGRNIGCRDKNSSWFKMDSPMVVRPTALLVYHEVRPRLRPHRRQAFSACS